MALALTIAGVAKTLKAGSLHISKTSNGRSTATLAIVSTDRSYRPALDAEVILTEGSTRIFAGMIDRTTERGLINAEAPGIITQISAVDFHGYAEFRYVKETLSAGTLKSQLTTLVANYLDDYGVTLDAGQVDGPGMPEIEYDYRVLADVLNDMAKLTADAGEPYVWRIDAFKVLRMFQPSTVAAPFDLVGNVLPEVFGDLEIETSRQGYANRVIVKVPPKTEIEREETFTEGVDAYPYVPQYTVMKTWGYITHDTIFETLRLPGDPDAASWTFDPVTQELTRDAGAPASGTVTIFKFDGVYEGFGIAEDVAAQAPPTGIREVVVLVDVVPSDTTIQAIADSELARRLNVPISARYQTFEPDIDASQEQLINVSWRNVNQSAVLSDVVIRDFTGDRLLRQVRAVVDNAKTNLDRGWRDVYKLWAGDKTGGVGTVTAGAVSSGGPGNPNTSVQFNRSGAFGGDGAFTYNETTNSVICGDLCTITAALHESCQVFGYNNHIADP